MGVAMDEPTAATELRLIANLQGGTGAVVKLVLAVGMTWAQLGAKILKKLKPGSGRTK